jgi:hypothetical protein
VTRANDDLKIYCSGCDSYCLCKGMPGGMFRLLSAQQRVHISRANRLGSARVGASTLGIHADVVPFIVMNSATVMYFQWLLLSYSNRSRQHCTLLNLAVI